VRQLWQNNNAIRLSVNQRLLLINALLLAAVIIVATMSWRAIDSQRRAVADLSLISRAARYHQDVDAQNTNLKSDVNAALASISIPSITRDTVLEALGEDLNQVRLDMHQLDRVDLPPDIAESFGRVRELEEIYRTRANDTVKAVFENPRSGIELLPDFEKSFEALQGEMLKQTGALARRIVAANEAAEDASQTAKRWMLTTAITISLTVCGLVGLLSASIRRSLRQVRDVAQAIAGGDLSARADASAQDEVGELAGAMNQLADNLSGMMDRLRNDAERDAFGTQLVEALEMADTEGEAYRVVARAMEVVSIQSPMELLVADSSRSHLERATHHPSAGSPGCSVESPFSCVAVRRGSATVFQDSSAINTCPQLRNRPCGAVSAVCVPLSFMGHSLGVLHATAPVNAPPSPKQVAQLSAIAQHAASRVGTLRVFHRTQLQASTDSLTGLSNRRTLEEHVHGLMANGLPYAFVLCDLDHFKKLNDTHGHDAGDKALRVFAEVLRGCMRSEDLPARWGGEEFALVLARANATQAAEAVERIRAALAAALLAGTAPAFTASYGIADSLMEPQLEQLARLADDALYQAKEAGRDRAIIAGDKSAADGVPRRDIEHMAEMDLEKFAAEYGAGLGTPGESRREAAAALLPLLQKANPRR
jgi:diguanylate cyclase (GGDEF)-like protein